MAARQWLLWAIRSVKRAPDFPKSIAPDTRDNKVFVSSRLLPRKKMQGRVEFPKSFDSTIRGAVHLAAQRRVAEGAWCGYACGNAHPSDPSRAVAHISGRRP